MRLHLVLTLVLAAAMLTLSACGSDNSNEYAGADGSAPYSIDAEVGEFNATITTDDGSAKVRSGKQVPVDLPKGFSIFPDAEIVTNTTFEGAGGKGMMIVLESNASPDEMGAYYLREAKAAGVKVTAEMAINGGKMIAGQDNKGIAFSFNASPAGGGTRAQLMIGDGLN